MKQKYFALTALATALTLAQSAAWATNGYFLPGAGFRSQGMGGVGIAYGRDSLSIAANPANVTKTGMRADMGFGVFNPERYAAVGESSGVKRPSGNPAVASFGFDSGSESENTLVLMPEMGMTMPLTEQLSMGVAFVANGGMNTTYPVNLFSYNAFNPDVPGSDAKLGVDLMQLLVPVTVGYKLNEDHAFGAAIQFAVTRFRAYGLEAFGYFDQNLSFPISADVDHLTGNGYDYSYGAGVKLGWQGEFLDDKLTLGLSYTSRTYMTNFDKYRGLFAEQGDFDIPENYGLGITVRPMKNLIVSADILRIMYADIASVGNPGPSTSNTPYNATNQVNGVISIPNPVFETGNDQGMGFGWNNQTVYKLGVQYGVNNRWLVRAGYNYGKSPIDNDQLTFNVLAPGLVEHHYSAGFTYRHSDELEITGMYMYVAPNSQSSPTNQNIVGSATANMHQNVFGLSLGWMLEPGPGAMDEYGTDEVGSIDFSNWYVGFGFGQSNYQDVASSLNSDFAAVGVTASTSANTGTEGWKFYTGYQFNKYLGLEGSFANLNDFTATSTTSSGTYITNGDSTAWTLAAVGTLPVTSDFAVIGKLGSSYVLNDVHLRDNQNTNSMTRTQQVGEDGYALYYGMGVSYALTDNFKLRADWERFDRDDIDSDLMTAGFVVAF